jgi:hypothetical protein
VSIAVSVFWSSFRGSALAGDGLGVDAIGLFAFNVEAFSAMLVVLKYRASSKVAEPIMTL